MELRQLGRSDLYVSVVGLGCNNFGGRIDLDQSRTVVDRAIDQGITLFDTADIYGNRGGSEEILGQILGARRRKIVLATKFGSPMDDSGAKQGGRRAYVVAACEESLRRLRTDYIDLYQMHRPDESTPIDETLGALNELVEQGKVRAIGSSNFTLTQTMDADKAAHERGWSPFVSCQDEYSLLVRSLDADGRLDTMARLGLSLLPYFPLASGLLTGKYRRGEAAPAGTRFAAWKHLGNRYATDANWDRVEKLERLADSSRHTMLELAFSWLAQRPAVASVIAGATKPEQIDANVRAANWTLTPNELAQIDSITGPQA